MQAQKLISLCGWEPRSLPYIVECKDQKYQSSKDDNPSHLSHGVADGHISSIVAYSSVVDETVEANYDSAASNRVQSDPHSVVLDCRLCGASVGLWTFTTVPRPLEFLRLVGCTEVDGEHDSAHHKEAANHGDIEPSGTLDLSIVNGVQNREGTLNTDFTSATSASGKGLNLSLTIAGGPPPAKQNFRATISLPVIGRNLRARISSDPNFRDRLCANNSFQGGKSHVEMSLMSDEDINEQGNNTPDSHNEKQVETTLNCVDGNSRKDKMLENTENIATGNEAVPACSSSHVDDSSLATTSVSETRRDWEIVGNNVSETVQPGASSLLQGPVTGKVCEKNLVETQDASGVKARLQPVDNAVLPWSIGKKIYSPSFCF